MLLTIWNFCLCVLHSLGEGLRKFNSLEVQSHYLRGENNRLSIRNVQLQEKVDALSTKHPKVEVQSPTEATAYKKLQEENSHLKADLEATRKQLQSANDKFDKVRIKLVSQTEALKALQKQVPTGPTGTAGN